jgi:oligopeptide/dipeptide ABC transporter ATP-binding protein
MLITHDLGVVAEMADRVVVMYAGQIVEEADVRTLFAHPLHPYTKGLLGSIPVLGVVRDRLDVIPGFVPNLLNPPPGCRFEPRCEICKGAARERCQVENPPLREVEPGHWARTWLYE